ncbi:MAG: nucleotidyltransferase family protein [Deltaproteobacteria bacterium]|jgi:mannose-1-phosphate guanylyltransferase|nr:nucleotidyltransferase family protein [Deltaproteobacteria bacterium]
MKAMILAAGFGTRLGILSKQRPKPMLPLGSRPIIGHLVHKLSIAGIKEIAVNLHYKGQVIRDYLGDGSGWGVKITYSDEKDEILGTGGGVKKLAEFFGDDPVLIINGKIATDIDFQEVIKFHKKKKKLATLVLKKDHLASKWGSFKVGPDGLITAMLGKDQNGNSVDSGPCMFTGIQILSPSFIEKLPSGYSCLVRQGYKPFFDQGCKFAGCVMPEQTYWWEHSTITRYYQGCMNLLKFPEHSTELSKISGMAEFLLEPEAKQFYFSPSIKTDGQIILGNRVIIGQNVHLQNNIQLNNCIIWPNTKVCTSLSHQIACPQGIIDVNIQEKGPYTGPATTPDPG